ncbi:MAG: lipid A deacylase LpxR family protein [Flavobacteriales bacterium]|nr:lipid A deacylase LpxR family protein [Flavobacteriales bacterium]
MAKFFLGFILMFYIMGWSQSSNEIVQRASYFNASYENDLFLGTDQYYSQGSRLSWASPIWGKSPILFFFPKMITHQEELHELSVEHDFYTPTDITADTLLVGDRPYACAFYFNQKMSVFNLSKKIAIHTSIDLGVFGSWALGEFSQKNFHRWTNSPDPKGWKYQIDNDILLNYAMQFQYGWVQTNWLEVVPSATLQLGTSKTYIALQPQLKLGWFNPLFKSEVNRKKKFQFYISSNAKMELIAYNALLQGGLINQQSPYTISPDNLQRFVFSAQVGAYMAIYNFNFGFTFHHLSSEFETAQTHQWGQIEARITF